MSRTSAGNAAIAGSASASVALRRGAGPPADAAAMAASTAPSARKAGPCRTPPRSRAGSRDAPCRSRAPSSRPGRARNGNTPLAAIAPNSTALMTVPVSRAICAMSNTCASRLYSRTTASRSALALRPSPSGIFSAVVRLRLVELRRCVRSRVAMPAPIWRTVSSSSEEASRSSAPGTGLRLNTGLLPPSSRVGDRKDFDVVGRRAGALGDAGNRRALRAVARAHGGVDQPLGEHAAAFAAERGDQDRDRLGAHAGCRARTWRAAASRSGARASAGSGSTSAR